MPLVMALVPLKCSSRNLQFSHRVPFTKEKNASVPFAFLKTSKQAWTRHMLTSKWLPVKKLLTCKSLLLSFLSYNWCVQFNLILVFLNKTRHTCRPKQVLQLKTFQIVTLTFFFWCDHVWIGIDWKTNSPFLARRLTALALKSRSIHIGLPSRIENIPHRQSALTKAIQYLDNIKQFFSPYMFFLTTKKNKINKTWWNFRDYMTP